MELNSVQRSSRLLWVAVTSVPAILLFFHWHTSVNVPTLDDYRAVLGFLVHWDRLDQLSDRLGVLLSAHNEHRIVVTRIFSLADVAIFDSVNFKRLGLYAVLALVPISIAIVRATHACNERRSDLVSPVVALVVVLLLCRPEDWKHLLYPMANIQALWSVAFSLLFLVDIVRARPGRNAFLVSLVWLVLAIGTNSSALLVGPLGGIALLVQRRFFPAAVLFFLSAVVSYLYLAGIDSGATKIPASFDDFLLVLKFSLGVAGSGFEPVLRSENFTVVLAGGFLLSVSMYVLLVTPVQNELATKLIILYLLGVCVLIGIGRASLYESELYERVLDGRYRIYSVALMALLAGRLTRIVASNRSSRGLVITVMLVLSIAFFTASSYQYNLKEWQKSAALQRERMTRYLVTFENQHLGSRAGLSSYVEEAVVRGLYLPEAEN